MKQPLFKWVEENGRALLFLTALPFLWYAIPLFTDNSYFFDDFNAQYRPWWTYARNRLLSGEFPLWNPHVFGGMPYYTNPETSLFYPIKFLFSTLPFSLAAPLVLTVNAIIGSIGFFVLLRHIKLSSLPATIGAIMFIYGSFMSYEVHIPYVNTIVWFPWQMLFLLQILRKPTFTRAVSLSLITACSFLGGSPEIFFICHIMLGIVVFYKLIDMAQHGEWKDMGCFVLAVAAAAILVIGLTSVALFPAAEFSRLSLKSNGITDPFSLKRVFFREQGLIPYIFPYLHTVFGAPYPPIFTLFFKIEPYVGAFAVLLAITALSSKRYRSFTPAASSLFLFSILMSMGTDTAFFPTMFKSFPFFRIFQWPQNYILIAYITLAICSAMGLDVLWNGTRKNLQRFCCLGIAYLLAGHLTLRHPVSMTFLIAGGGAFAVCLYLLRLPASQPSPLLRKATGTVVVGLAILELFIFSFSYRVYMPEKTLSMHHFKPAIDYVRSNSTYERSAFSARAMEVYFMNQQEYFTSYIPLAENIPFAKRNCGNMNHYHRRLDKAVLSNLQWERRNAYLHNYDWSFDYPVNAAMIFGYSDISGYDSFRLRRIDEFYRTVPFRKTLDIFNVKWLVLPEEISRDHLTASFAGGGLYIYKNKTAAPRVLLPTEVAGGLSDKEILERMSSNTFDPCKTVLFDLPVTDSSLDRPTGEAEIVSYHPERVEIKLSMKQSGYLVLNDIYYPGWKAYLNGNEIPIIRANYLFRAVAIPGGGDYTLVFRFEPDIFRKSAAVSIVSWIFCLAVISAGSIRKRREEQS